ncbi:MAG: alpha-1,4-glucan--maltose-1-phosphate maltosyltransferase [Chloroflexi bacterium]|nr:alpha-1,4-glucan--maltose-1-phosphate maltosyltransferase [Chloroflexota bacterium]
MQSEEGRRRVIIQGVKPEIDGGRYPAKRTVGDLVVVEAQIFGDGHDVISAVLKYRKEQSRDWAEATLKPVDNDWWRGEFTVTDIGRYRYTLQAWVDRLGTWKRDLIKKVDARQDVSVDLLVGSVLVKEMSERAAGSDVQTLQEYARVLRRAGDDLPLALERALDDELARMMEKYPDRRFAAIYPRELSVVVDREKARFSAWYEMFPRSCSPEPGRHGTFKDCEDRLAYVASMGFDVLYLPPIHPIGKTHRKGKNNSPTPESDDPGSPWAIGSKEGGHKSVHPQLGTVEDFRRLVDRAAKSGIEIALDLAFQCSPDHPYVSEHPEWFSWRPDNTVQYAENPPKKYQDLYPFDFETDCWQSLWDELKGIVLFWIGQGIRIFRVDNPHTKPFRFWEWLIGEVKKDYPDVIFLSEAFTRPSVMYHLAKLGFTQSYTYFAWRNTKWELTNYLKELTQTDVREYFRPSLWPNTPDILPENLQFGGRPAFMARLVLAATLGASYGIYGPAFELCENRSREPGSEEYLDSEKYEIKRWEVGRTDSLRDFIARVNRIRRENAVLRHDRSLRFHPVDNDRIICYSKSTADLSDTVVVVVSLDPHHTQAGWVELPLETLGLDPKQPYQMHDLLGDARYLWHGPRNYVELNPQIAPAQVYRVRRRVRTEREFEYYA